MYVDQHWRITEKEENGSIIVRVRAEDAENDILQFGLEPHYLNRGKNIDSYPFRIDSSTGVVYLNESLKGRGGESFFLYITVTDGQLTAKNEVLVDILKSDDNSKLYEIRNPSFTQTVRNLSQVLPPFHLLPGVINSRPLNNNNLPPIPVNTYPATTEDPIAKEPTRTKLTAVHQNSNESSENTKNNIQLNKVGNTIEVLDNEPSLSSSFKIILTTIATLLVVLLLATIIIVFIKGRQNMWVFGKYKKKKSDDIKKKSNLSSNFTSSTVESQNSMSLNSWIGPSASNNRYVPWERDAQQVSILF